jgi:hypothetical protein
MATERAPFFGFGAHDVMLYQKSNGMTLAHLRVIGDISGDFTADTVKVEGGSQNYSWATAVTGFKGSLKMKVKEYDPDAMAIFMGGTLTDYSAAATGDVVDEANVQGTDLYSATGFATVTVTSGDSADLKSGWYLLKATDATHCMLYAYSSSTLKSGTDEAFESELGALWDAAVEIPSDPTTGKITDATTGLEFTRGGEARSVTSGSTMRFFVQAPMTVGWKIKFGENAATFSDVGVMISGELNDGDIMFAHFYSCKCLGAPIMFPRKGFAEFDITVEPSYDSTLDGVGEIQYVRGA